VSTPTDAAASFTLPPVVAQCVARLPQWPPAALLAGALSLALGRLVEVEPLAPLRGRCLELRVIDAGLRLRLSFTGQRFLPVLDARPADVTISANAWDFLLLARRQADPDSLFFSRRLVMEGDTELGLLVKNTLDAIDFAGLFPGLRGRRAGS
jgi:predicted lipid carrier protein YhbT